MLEGGVAIGRIGVYRENAISDRTTRQKSLFHRHFAGQESSEAVDCNKIRSPHHSGGESETRTSEPKPH